MKITEPTTTITDYLLALEAIVLGVLLLRNTPPFPVKLLAFSFFALAIAALAGGTYHGFINSLSPSAARGVWKITLFSIGVATFMMLTGVLLVYLPGPILALAILQFIIYMVIMTKTNDFRYVVYNYVPAMVAILVLALLHHNHWLTGAVALSFLGAAIQRSGLQLHKHFNFNDIYHLVQMVGMYFFYRGGKLFGLQTN